ncbi:ABC transporter ATP-binding protein [Veronia pacifica]|uniref:ATP-binding protein n=1 Tax=Veronia pacifica TaxID=1080227 RepID=A0A1C3EDA4_9GAMM|nr:ABC transporter ATP-binding protein [Veronia pacifica]ODA31226.1 ATP-binding protein [Veronia pacifica]
MISVSELCFSYPSSENKTLKNIAFSVKEGEIFGFLGPSGSGKSTTQKILCGLLRGYEGEAKILDKEVRDWGRQLYQKIGVGFELPNHYDALSALENLNLFAAMYSDANQPEYLLERVGLLEHKDKPVNSYSKGMKMRLNFARALLGKPQLVFFDEPTSGLDPTNSVKIREYIKELQQQGVTVFITTHNMHDADELCDQVGFISDGKIMNIDAPFEMKQQYGKNQIEVTYSDHLITKKKSFPLEKIGEDSEFFALLKNSKIKNIHSQEASLEQVFIELTGVSLT